MEEEEEEDNIAYNSFKTKLFFVVNLFFSIFAMVDSENHCLPVTVYNMAVGTGFAVGDSIAIPEPFCQETDFTENDKVSGYTIVLPMYTLSLFAALDTIRG